jgi:hypothetical protein
MNGWSNRQTWLLVVHNFYEGAFDEGQFGSVTELAVTMESLFDEWAEENRPKNLLASDLFCTSDIDFYEIASHYTDFVRVEAEDEDEDDGA